MPVATEMFKQRARRAYNILSSYTALYEGRDERGIDKKKSCVFIFAQSCRSVAGSYLYSLASPAELAVSQPSSRERTFKLYSWEISDWSAAAVGIIIIQ